MKEIKVKSDLRPRYRDIHFASRGSREYYNGDIPPMSRLFVICDKSHNEEDIRDAFKKFGNIEDIHVVKDKDTNRKKGIVYIKFSKTSDAARAQEEMNGKSIGKADRPLKVLVAANRNQGSNKSEKDHDRYVRLFIVIPKEVTEDEIRMEFSQWGNVENVTVLKEKGTGNPKGFGYVRFSKFYDAALALENCSPKYKAVFAEPRESNRTEKYQDRRPYEDHSMKSNLGGRLHNFNNSYNSWTNPPIKCDMTSFLRMQNFAPWEHTVLQVIASSKLNPEQVRRVFDIIPGLRYCQTAREYGTRTNEFQVAYHNTKAALYAKDKLHGLEYPIGERLIVKVGVMNAFTDNSSIDMNIKKESICNVPLPPLQPLAPWDAPVQKRLFIVLSANLSESILTNVFSCWKGLIDVFMLPNKNFGYVRYADRESAQRVIQVLHGAEICGAKIKVMEAEEKRASDSDDGDRKRLRRS